MVVQLLADADVEPAQRLVANAENAVLLDQRVVVLNRGAHLLVRQGSDGLGVFIERLRERWNGCGS